MAKAKMLKTKYKSIFRYKTKNGFKYLFRLKYKNEYDEWKEKTQSGFLTLEDAKNKHSELELSIRKGANAQLYLNGIKFGEWFERYCGIMEISWSLTTKKRIESEYKNHLIYFQNKCITKITLITVQEFVNKKIKEGLAVSTVKNIYKTMMQVMNTAVKHDLIAKNKLIYVVFPRMEKKENKMIEEKDLERLDLYIYNELNILEQVMYMLARIGWRRGEVAGLRFSAFDVKEDGSVGVSVAKARNHYTKEEGEKLKTSASYRENYLIGENAKRFILAIETSKQYYDESNIRRTDDSFVFLNPKTKKMYHPERLSQVMKKANKTLNLSVTPHMLRHTFISNLMRDGASLAEVAKWVGHSRLETTLNIYTHSSPDDYANLITLI